MQSAKATPAYSAGTKSSRLTLAKASRIFASSTSPALICCLSICWRANSRFIFFSIPDSARWNWLCWRPEDYAFSIRVTRQYTWHYGEYHQFASEPCDMLGALSDRLFQPFTGSLAGLVFCFFCYSEDNHERKSRTPVCRNRSADRRCLEVIPRFFYLFEPLSASNDRKNGLNSPLLQQYIPESDMPWPGLFMNTLAPWLDPGPHTGFPSLGNTHRYSARSENPVCKRCSAQSSRRSMNKPG